MKIRLVIIVLGLLWSSNSYAVENWKIEKILKNTFTEVSTAGLMCKGCEYRLHISKKGGCKTVEDGFTFYTRVNNPEILNMVGKKIKLQAMGSTIVSEIKAVVPVLNGSHHLVWITNGLYELDGHKEFLGEKETMEVKLLVLFDDFKKRTGWEAKDFFDEPTNSWSLKNVSEALEQGQKICLGNL